MDVRSSGQWRRRRTQALAVAAAAALIACLSSCVSTVTPPDSPGDPCDAHVLTGGRHMAILLPDPEGGFVEYGYGDWDWFAECHDSWYNVFDTILWPTDGCLGRRRVGQGTVDHCRAKGLLFTVSVERRLADALLSSLTLAFEGSRETEIFNSRYDLHFVRAGGGYWFAHNCHDKLAAWLEELGCDVAWAPIRTGVALRQAR